MFQAYANDVQSGVEGARCSKGNTGHEEDGEAGELHCGVCGLIW